MSHILFSSDNLTISWDTYDTETSALEKQKYLRLSISILINWKLKTFNLQFTICKWTEFWLWEEYTFINWYEWETFRSTIENLWYSLWDFSISRAIEELTSEQLLTVTEIKR